MSHDILPRLVVPSYRREVEGDEAKETHASSQTPTRKRVAILGKDVAMALIGMTMDEAAKFFADQAAKVEVGADVSLTWDYDVRSPDDDCSLFILTTRDETDDEMEERLAREA